MAMGVFASTAEGFAKRLNQKVIKKKMRAGSARGAAPLNPAGGERNEIATFAAKKLSVPQP